MTPKQSPITANNASILVVDDTAANLDLLESILVTAHYDVRLAPSGLLALRSAYAETPDLILLDVKMPELNGYDVCVKLKADARTRDIPIIFISALQDTEDKIRGFAVGGVDYIPKPFQAEEVLARVATHLRLQRLQKTLHEANSQLHALLEEQLRDRRQLEEAAVVFQVSSEGIMLTDVDGVIQRVNPAFTAITGYSADEAIGQTPKLLKSGHHSPEFYQAIWLSILTEGYWEGEIWNRRKDGSVYLEWEMITTLRNFQGETVGYISQFSDMLRRKLTDDEILYCGNYDALTGLANRTLLLERMEHALKEHRRKRRKLALLLLDLDKFKQINDTLSYNIGDMLLQQVAKRISKELRDTDTAARLGGDEFAIMLTDLENQTPSERVAMRILDSLQQPFSLEAQEIHISASIGITIFPDDGDSVEVLLRNADFALDRAKSRAKSNNGPRAQFFTEDMELAFLARSRVEVDLRHALKDSELLVYYQPIVDLRTGATVGVEALVRWLHPTLGLVSPDRFIPVAEETGLINQLGKVVIETVCTQLQYWYAQGRDLYISVNVSTLQIPHGLTPEYLQTLIQEAQVNPLQLVLEITESVLAQDIAVVVKWLHQIRALGIRVYLDDFGTGYASLSYLKHFPVDAIKIDQSFVREVATHYRDQALVRAIVTLSHGLGLKSVVEGIETQEQLEVLRTLNCTYGQGYLFSKPLPYAELETFLQRPTPYEFNPTPNPSLTGEGEI